MANEDLDRVAIKVSNTQAVDPVLAIQFLNSALNISGSWEDLGHADCTKDLTDIIRKILGAEIEFGLVARKFDGGKYSEKTPQVMMVECDRRDVPQVQKDLVEAFAKIDNSEIFPQSKTSKKERIKNGLVTNWVAIPTFSSVASKSDISKVALYSQLMAQESTYRSNLLSCKVKGIQLGKLDKPAPESSYLTPEVLQQMENEMIQRGDTPIRHLIWDVMFKETKKEMVLLQIPKDTPTEKMESKIKELKLTITWKEVIEKMQSKGISVPYSSLPVPKPSKLSLRQKLLGLKSRKYAGDNMLVFESVTLLTDDGELLLTFKKHVAEEAHAIAELLPLFIKHEMNVDPMFYCSPELLQVAQDGYYNPLSRSGFLGLLKNTQEKRLEVSKKIGLPEFCMEMSGADLVKVFKCPGFSSLPMIAEVEDDDLASLANTIATSPNPAKLPESGVIGLENLLREAKLIDTQKQDDDISEISEASFDSKGSFNRYRINERAQVLASKLQKEKAMKDMIEAQKKSSLSELERNMFCKIGGFTKKEFQAEFPEEFKHIWSESEDEVESVMEIDVSNEDSEESEAEEEEERSSTDESEASKDGTLEDLTKKTDMTLIEVAKDTTEECQRFNQSVGSTRANEEEEQECDESSTSTPKRGSPSKSVGVPKVKGKVRRKVKATKKPSGKVSTIKAAGSLNSGKIP